MMIMTTTFVSCGAKLPIIALIADAFFDNAGWVSWSAYLVGIMSIICSGIILKKTGTIIMLSTVVLWFLMCFGWSEEGFGMIEELSESIPRVWITAEDCLYSTYSIIIERRLIMGTFITTIILLAVVGLAVRSMVRDRKRGKSLQCGGDCSQCKGCH